jgi:hypothetical protein
MYVTLFRLAQRRSERHNRLTNRCVEQVFAVESQKPVQIFQKARLPAGLFGFCHSSHATCSAPT